MSTEAAPETTEPELLRVTLNSNSGSALDQLCHLTTDAEALTRRTLCGLDPTHPPATSVPTRSIHWTTWIASSPWPICTSCARQAGLDPAAPQLTRPRRPQPAPRPEPRDSRYGVPPTPDQFRRGLTALMQTAGEVMGAYRWVHASAYGSDRRGEMIKEGAPGGRGTDRDVGDPTGELAANRRKQHQRSALGEADRRVKAAFETATAELRSALYTLRRALPDPDPAPVTLEPSTLTRAEKRASEEAAARRDERGEGIPT